MHQEEKVDKLFTEWDKLDSPGYVLGIIQKGQIVYQQAYGMADLEREVPLTIDSIFDIASISKQFVATCIAILVEQRHLSFNDDIRQYIPEISFYDDPILVQHLVYHTSGIRDYMSLMSLAGMRHENRYFPDEILTLIAQQKSLNFQPGEKYSYSNSGYFLLSEIITRVTGKSLGEYARENIFQPLGMTKTQFFDDCKRIVKHRAISYAAKKNGESGYVTVPYIFDIVGDTGLLTNIEDLYLWDQNFYSNKIGKGKQTLIDLLLTPGKLNNGELLNYGCGHFFEIYKGLPIVCHSGGAAGYLSQFIRFPDQQFSVILLSNLAEMKSPLILKIIDIYLSDFFKLNSKKSNNTRSMNSEDPSEKITEK